MGWTDKAVRVEKCIVRREGGTYSVKVRDGHRYVCGSFRTLREARKFRDQAIKSRPKREPLRGRPDAASDISLTIADVKKQIAEARKKAKTIIRDGREYKLVKL